MNDEVKLGGRVPIKCGECVYRNKIQGPIYGKNICCNPESPCFTERKYKQSASCEKGECNLETTIDNVALDNLEKEEIKPVVKYHYPVAILYEGKVYGMDWDNDKLVQKAVRDATPKELKYNCVLNQEF